jgi:hypothetical protein
LVKVLHALALGLIAGYASAFFSRTACEDRVAADVIRWPRQTDVYAVSDWSTASSAIFDRAHVTTHACDVSNLNRCSPLAGVQRGEVTAPFVVSVRWTVSGSPGARTDGSGGRRRFLCVFGFLFELAEAEYSTS